MNIRGTVLLALAAIVLAAPARAQGARTTSDLAHPQPVEKTVDGGNKTSQEANVTPVMSKPLPDFPGKEVVMITVTYSPGSSGPVHRHNAHAFVYVLEGRIVMGLNGGESVTLAPGQAFYEGPNDIHTIGRNASKTRPAKFLVFLIKDRDAPILVPVN